MKFHYMGKYNDNPDDLPYKEHEPGAVKFVEPDSGMKLAVIANGLSVVILILLTILMRFCTGEIVFRPLGLILGLLTMVPHEFLHAACFREDVYMYTYLRKGMLFVTGPERMSKSRFIFMSMLPNIVFGFIPYILFLIHPEWDILGGMGILCISMGAGDYINVFNTITQVPKGAKVYLHKFNSYWYREGDC